MFRNILVSVDGSPHSGRALAEAIDIASGSGARLTIITAVPTMHGYIYTPTSAAALESLAADLEREFDGILKAAVDSVPASIPVTKILTHKPIRKALMHQVQEGRHDLLVMGSRGRGAVSSSLLGSVSHFVLNHARIPVLIVHDETDLEITPRDADRTLQARPVAAA
jgi:nucleotide-binding universal stress UspA family protein